MAVIAVMAVMPAMPLAAQGADWPAYGRDLAGTRYLPSSVITPANVTTLQPAWSYRTGETGESFNTDKPASFEATPIVVDGIMYIGTPLGRVIALDAVTGAERWVYDPRIARDIEYGDFANRGVSTWLDSAASPGADCRRRIFTATAQSQLVALDAATGKPCSKFGKGGMVDLKAGLRIPPFEPGAYTMTSPPVAANGLVVVGSSIGDNSRPQPASGEVRAYDARTGALRWSWDPIPQDPKDPYYSTWRGELAQKTGAANAWTALSADPARDLLFVPTSSAAPDYYGVLRLGDNRYANSIVALRLSTGKVVWSFQTVHHDLWDYDNASPPALLTVQHQGRDVPAVLQATKTGMLFVLDRLSGKPLFPVEERPVPKSTIPGEEASPTQPFTVVPEPLSPHHVSVTDAWGLTDQDREACRAVMAGVRYEGPFTPPSTQGTLVLPSNVGGAHWGGVAVDPVRQVAVIPVNRVGAIVQLIPRDQYRGDSLHSEDERVGYEFEYNMMRGTPYVMRRRLLVGPTRLPCTPPPWGNLVAIDLRTGGKLWDVPLGSITAPFPDALKSVVRKEWGSLNLGGPITTAGGIVFIGATLDRSLHAFDITTGKELWTGALPESARSTPMGYEVNGEQYVAIAVGGGDVFGRGDYVVVFKAR